MESKYNPAEHTSRGLTAEKFIDCKEWFNVPGFLRKSEDNWPSSSINRELNDNDPEVKSHIKVVVTGVKEKKSCLITTRERLIWIKRVLAIIVKVIKQKSFSRVNVAVEDLQEAEKLLISWVQSEAF